MTIEHILYIVIVIAILSFTSKIWLGDVIGGGRRLAHHRPKRIKHFRQFPTFPVQILEQEVDEEEEEENE